MESSWFLLSLGAAFFMATNAAFMKRFFSDIPPWDMAVIPFLYSAPLCMVGMLFVDIPLLKDGFWLHLAWVLPLTMIAMVLHFRAIHASPLSLTMPFLAFTPVFVILTGQLLLDETIPATGVLGIMLIVIGGYVLNIDSVKYGILGPIKAIFREPGSAIMLLVACLYGLCAVGGKVLIVKSSPMFAAMFLFTLYGPLLALIMTCFGKTSPRTIFRRPGLGIIIGVMIFIEIICHNFAISMVEAAYMVAIKRLAGLFSVIYGWWLFNESGIRYRIIGTLVMTAGTAIIAFKP